MDMSLIMQYGPKLFVILIGLWLFFELRKYKRKNDIPIWMRDLYATVTRAAKDEDFRRSELADAEAKIAKYAVPGTIAPITRWQQVSLVVFPKFMFMTGVTGVIMLYLAWFETAPSGVYWPLYVSWGFLGVTLVLWALVERTKSYYGRVQQINRKYLLQKAVGEKERFDSLREVLEYYPAVAPLWLELGDQLAVADQMDKAVDAVEKARQLEPKNVDYALVLASFSLRRKHHAKVEALLEEAEKMKQVASDPRVEIYRAGLALQRNEKRKAEKHCRTAMELDKEFTTQLMQRDKGLQDLTAMWRSVCGEGEWPEDEENDQEKVQQTAADAAGAETGDDSGEESNSETDSEEEKEVEARERAG